MKRGTKIRRHINRIRGPDTRVTPAKIEGKREKRRGQSILGAAFRCERIKEKEYD